MWIDLYSDKFFCGKEWKNYSKMYKNVHVYLSVTFFSDSEILDQILYPLVKWPILSKNPQTSKSLVGIS